jgi:hypothetical protein
MGNSTISIGTPVGKAYGIIIEILVLGPTGIWGTRKGIKKRNRQSITVSPSG